MGLRRVDEAVITRAIVRRALEDIISCAEVDAIVVGAGPSGLTAARYLARGNARTIVLERRLSFGGGIGGGGMLFPKVVVERPADEALREVGVRLEEYEEGVYVADPAEMMAKMAVGAIDAGAKIILGVTVEDVAFKGGEITGVVVQWTAVRESGLHVDPLAFRSKAVIDCTGHAAEVLSVAARKIPDLRLKVLGEASMHAPAAERLIVEHAGQVRPGLFAAGMAVAALYGLPRMGPIFGGMLLSGRKVAGLVLRRVKGQ
ncbi:TPA: thiazole biosynthesis protein [Candidatus Bathyarchaeota archaeon]|nr:thiazole biosynthesis protein [Candidatus Bathyarchaeota archaeon]